MGSLSYFATDKYTGTDGLSVFLGTIMSLSCIRINSKIVLDHFFGELLQIELLLLLLHRLLWSLGCFTFRLEYLLRYLVVMQLTGFLCLTTGCY
jgi:prepilin signal peptidase PulO-like enzyme (type II secretory pathway)